MDFKRGMNWFAPATSPKNFPGGAIVLPTKLFMRDWTGSPGILLSPVDAKDINSPPYDRFLIKERLAQINVHFSFYPALETTIMPVDFQNFGEASLSLIEVEKTNFILQHGTTKERVPGSRASVKLDFMIWHANKWARRFQIDGILLDPKFKHLIMNPDNSLCFLGMDFMIKHPHLLFRLNYDSHHELEFKLAKGPFTDRSYKISTNSWGEVIIYVGCYYNIETGNIGCGAFFKSGSIFNFFGGVSRFDTFGRPLDCLWKERGILVAIIKALEVIEASSVGRDSIPKTVIIRTSNSEIGGILAPIKWFATRIRPPYEDQSVQDLENIFPPTVRDVAMYYYHKFVQRQPRFKIKIQNVATSERFCGILAANLLATAGAEMVEFSMTVAGNELRSKPSWGYHNMTGLQSPDTIPLESYFGVRSSTIYVSFGTDGYFLISRKKAHAATAAADEAGMESFVEEAIDKKAQILEKNTTTMLKSTGLSLYQLGPHGGNDTSSFKNTGCIIKAPNDCMKGKPKQRVGEHSHKRKICNKIITPQSLLEFDNDWTNVYDADVLDSGLSTGYGTKPNHLKATKQTRYDSQCCGSQLSRGRGDLRLMDTETVLWGWGQVPVVANGKGMYDLRSPENIEASQSDIWKVIETWKIKPKGTNRLEVHDICGIDCKCRVTGGGNCEPCNCKSERNRKITAIPAVVEETAKKAQERVLEVSDKFEHRHKLTGANHPRIPVEARSSRTVEFERNTTGSGEPRFSYPSTVTDEKNCYEEALRHYGKSHSYGTQFEKKNQQKGCCGLQKRTQNTKHIQTLKAPRGQL